MTRTHTNNSVAKQSSPSCCRKMNPEVVRWGSALIQAIPGLVHPSPELQFSNFLEKFFNSLHVPFSPSTLPFQLPWIVWRRCCIPCHHPSGPSSLSSRVQSCSFPLSAGLATTTKEHCLPLQQSCLRNGGKPIFSVMLSLTNGHYSCEILRIRAGYYIF